MTAYLNALGVICNLGRGKQEVAAALFAGDASSIRTEAGWAPRRSLPLGAVTHELPPIPPALAATRENRANRLLLAAALEIEGDIRAAIHRHGEHRVGVVIGTSTTGIERTTEAIDHRHQHGQWPDDYRYADQELGAPAEFLAEWLALSGPAYGISTACTSGARALISAQRLLQMGVCDAVLCGGVDTLARLPVNGFLALEALDADHCQPFSQNRRGINIGEAAALFLMTHEHGRVVLAGSGASSDAYHMSSPDPQGLGAQQAMRDALARAQLDPGQIDYVNLHGTATEHNDRMESRAMAAVFPRGVPCSSTKSLTGHTLAAAGALEAAFCCLILMERDHRLPRPVWDGVADPELAALNLIDTQRRLPTQAMRRLMSNSFAFGGNNDSLILADAGAGNSEEIPP
jgi:3-oxoacyl-[acyl-carrier-protein] synthase-1